MFAAERTIVANKNQTPRKRDINHLREISSESIYARYLPDGEVMAGVRPQGMDTLEPVATKDVMGRFGCRPYGGGDPEAQLDVSFAGSAPGLRLTLRWALFAVTDTASQIDQMLGRQKIA
jgi:hypothetical protein